MTKVCSFVFVFIAFNAISQNGAINETGANPNADAILNLQSDSKGLLIPRLQLSSTTNAQPISTHVLGMQVYNTATANDVSPGMYFNDGVKWVKMDDRNILNSNGSLNENREVNFNNNNLSFNGSGNVGIGTNLPGEKLEVSGGNVKINRACC